MATGIKAVGVDLDAIFEPRTGTKIADVNIKSNGSVDLSNRFEDLASGSAPPATGIKKGGADLNTLFAELGSVSACSAGSSTIPNITDVVIDPNLAQTGARWNANGEVYYYPPGNGFPGTSNGGTWIGSCANTEYEGRWIKISGTNPNVANPAVNVWRAMNLNVDITYSSFGTITGSFEFQLRRKSDQQVILTDAFIMTAQVNPDPGK